MVKSKQTGFTLMEVLIAMLVIGIGLLGYLSLQLTSINSNQEGMARTQATLIAQDLAAAIRSNRAYVNQGNGANNVGNAYSTGNYNSCDVVVDCSAGCTAEQQAAYDVYQVCQSLKGFDSVNAESDLLVGGEVHVTCDDRDTGDADACSPGSTLSIFTYWQASALREDTGQTDFIRNARCDALAPTATSDCVILDIMP
ncbi:type IV pilus modification protein PilV [Kangiella sediminilitoris]|uniref:Type IV pilus modification protein PilV n=1 Tax=Kangiella sediminilitoris TaxID=1144748 RepID=A0A1B3BBE4_9GAMM|nr:type IV pilus modification protein PilV [Kangiella sediminilitoris]AOE50096.1 Type IV pilus modification protein PilV [Kangiella sediminilitoris]